MHQLDFGLCLPPEGLPVADNLERVNSVVCRAHLEHLPKGATAKMSENLEQLAARRCDLIRDSDDEVAQLVVGATAEVVPHRDDGRSGSTGEMQCKAADGLATGSHRIPAC